ncbi:MAG: hypothetical protein ACPGVG_15260 [Mycobacterium sp.]
MNKRIGCLLLLTLASGCIRPASAQNEMRKSTDADRMKSSGAMIGGKWAGPGCLPTAPGGAIPQVVPWEAQIVVTADGASGFFWSMIPYGDINTVTEATMGITDTDSGAGVPDVDGDGSFNDAAPDGFPQGIPFVNAGSRSWVNEKAAFKSVNSILRASGACFDASLVTNGRPCREDNDCVDASYTTCRGGGVASLEVDQFDNITGAYLCVMGSVTAGASNE